MPIRVEIFEGTTMRQMLTMLLLLMCMTNIVQSTEPTKDQIETFKTTVEKHSEKAVIEIQKRLTILLQSQRSLASIKDRKKRTEQAVSLRNQITVAKNDLALAKKGELKLSPEINLQVGIIGKINSLSLVQKIDADSGIAHFHYETIKTTGGPTIETIRFTKEYKTVDIWIQGFNNLTNLADNQHIPTSGFYLVSGTKTYQTVGGGSKTLLVIEPLIIPKEEQEYFNKVR